MARQRIDVAAANGAWSQIIGAAQASPSLLTCAQVDILWNLGEAFARTGDLARSFDVYAYVLKTCEDGGARLATVQKASQVLPVQGRDALLALGRTGPMGGEFDAVRFDTLRGAMGRVASGETGTLPAATELAAFADYVGRSRSAPDAALFGWYFFGQKQWKDAAGWFRAAGQITDDPKALEGLILSLRNGGDVSAASSMAFEARARSPEITKIYVEMEAERLTADGATPPSDAEQRRYGDVVEQARSSLGAQAIGWSLIAQGKPDAARTWFRRSVEWQETSEGVIGLAVAASRLKDKAGLQEIKSRYGDKYPEVADLEDAPVAVAKATRRAAGVTGGQRRGGGGQDKILRQAQKQFDSGDYKSALASLDQHERTFGRNRGAELLKGWTNLKMRRYQEARAIFKAEDKRGSTKDTRFGIGATFNSQFNAWSSN
jgi:cellulose synthase operon protein C